MSKKEYIDEDTKEESYKVWAKLITIASLVFLVWFFLLRSSTESDVFEPSLKNDVVIELAKKYYGEELEKDSTPVFSDFEIEWTTIEYGIYTAVATSFVSSDIDISYVTTWEYILRWDSMELKDVIYSNKHYEVK